MPSILDKIVAKKREELAASKWTVSMESLREAIADRSPALDFAGALRRMGSA